VLVEEGGVQRRFFFCGVAVRGGGLVYKPRGGSLLVVRGGDFCGLRGLHADLESGGAVELNGVLFDVSDFAVSTGVEGDRAYSVTAHCAKGVFCVGLWGGVGFSRLSGGRRCGDVALRCGGRCRHGAVRLFCRPGGRDLGGVFMQRVRVPLLGVSREGRH